MEVSYFVECEKKARKTRDVNNLPCFIASQDGLPNKNVLVLSTKQNLPISSPESIEYIRTNSPMTISFTGKQVLIYQKNKKSQGSNEKLNFVIDENTEVFNGCSFTLKNEFWVAGGSGNARYQVRNNQRSYINNFQLKKIDNCAFKTMDRLPFGFARGGCNTFTIQLVEQSWLCFGDMTRFNDNTAMTSKQCYAWVDIAIELRLM